MSVYPEGIDELPDEAEERHAYRINSKGEAAWGMDKLRHYREQITENRKIAQERADAITATIQERVDEITAWENSENAKLQRSVDFFEGLLQTYHMDQVQADPSDEEAWKKEKFKTISFPDGTLSVRKTSSIEIENEKRTVDWALHNHKDLLKMSINKSAISELKPIRREDGTLVTGDGEIIPGVRENKALSWKVTPK